MFGVSLNSGSRAASWECRSLLGLLVARLTPASSVTSMPSMPISRM